MTNIMKKFSAFMALVFLAVLVGCDARKGKTQGAVVENEGVADSTVYGVCGDGTSMHSLELITDAGDTLVYMINDWESNRGQDHEGIV